MEQKVALQIQHHFFCDEMLEIAAAGGFRYISMGYGSSKCFHGENWITEVENLKAKMNTLGLSCVMTHAPYYDLRISAEVLDEAMEQALLRCVRATGILGAEIMAVHPRGFYRNGTEETEQSYLCNVRNFLPLVTEAKVSHCRIGIENLPVFSGWDMTFYSNFPEEHLRLIRAFDLDAVGAVWDFGHSYLANENSVETLTAFSGLVRGTHIHDNHRGSDEHLIPFLGTIDWKEEMHALKRTGFDGYLTLEADYEQLNGDRNALCVFVRQAYENVSLLDSMLSN